MAWWKPFTEEIRLMKTISIVGIVLIVLGIAALAFQSITFTTDEKVAEVGPIEVTKESKRSIPLPPLLGALALAGGVLMLIVGGKKS
jgi:hypothetical protein